MNNPSENSSSDVTVKVEDVHLAEEEGAHYSRYFNRGNYIRKPKGANGSLSVPRGR